MTKIEEDFGHGGGKLVATSAGWKLSFYLPGPDGRYAGKFVEFGHRDQDLLVSAYTDGMQWFLSSRNKVPANAEVTQQWRGDNRITLRVSSWAAGVCLGSYHHPTNDALGGELVARRVRLAYERGPYLVSMCHQISSGRVEAEAALSSITGRTRVQGVSTP